MALHELKRALFGKKQAALLLVLALLNLLILSNYCVQSRQFTLGEEEKNYYGMPLKEIRSELDLLTAEADMTVAFRYISLSRQVDYMLRFDETVQGILDRAANMSTVSIFAGSPYSQANIRKTAADYSNLSGLELTLGNDLPVIAVMDNSISDYFITAFVLLVVFSFLAERRRGLWNAVNASPNGRVRLALWRIVVVAAGAVLAGLIISATEILFCYGFFGNWDELDRLAQSCYYFQNLTIPLSIGQLWILYTLLRVFGAFVIGCIAWFLLEMAVDRRLIGAVWAAVAIAEYTLTGLPEANILRQVNLFTYLSPRQLVTEYCNLNVFGTPTGLTKTVLLFACILLPLLLGSILWVYAKRKPIDSIRWLDTAIDRIRRLLPRTGSHTGLLRHELYRSLVTGRGWVILLGGLVAVLLLAQPSVSVGGEVSEYLESYLRQSQGPVSTATDDYLLQRQQRLDGLYTEREDLNRQYNDGELSANDYSQQMHRFTDLEQQRMALDAYREWITSLKQRSGSYVLPQWVFEIMLGVRGNAPGVTLFLSGLAVMLLLLNQAGTERKTGMLRTRNATPRGRKELRIYRHGAAWLISIGTSIIAWGTFLLQLYRNYGELRWLNAPVRCLVSFSHLTSDISILGYFMTQVGIKTIALCLISSLVLIVMEVRESHGT